MAGRELRGTGGRAQDSAVQRPLLAVEDLVVQFRLYEGVARVLNGVRLTVGRGERVALVGETGCGKSLTARAILGLLPPAARVSGRILWEGTDLLSLSERALQAIRGRQIALVFQDPGTALNPVFTVGEQMLDVAAWQGAPRARLLGRSDGALRRRCLEMLRVVRIPDPEGIWHRYPVELSGGMRQRVQIALALLGDPRLLIADELGTALDVSIQDQILQELGDLVRTRGLSVLYITHNLGVARTVSDRICVMYAGEIVETSPTADLFRRPLHPYSQGLLAAVPRLDGRIGEGIDGRIPDYTAPPPACRFAPRCPFRMEICDRVRPTLLEAEAGRQVACHLYPREGT
ncbi:MAG: ABC transporter ATP-binding protein [Armatimonadota bacterium]|nr:ABC transporter ATP-binding protein [Armatimonadota bacterium]MDR7402019.1 ABC transporter ATP-binding protein [Armatimonadota bacterium]MDR7404509.1 ABC transporter ATP-binding protein [Armatimonadota bacterium]MDR7437960.1 ABC transporter ATP-binding protein [Armatimonadota bacterium]MDR7473086.1 ABC transporter ATP-binding protein [Armatimonadota bacterium]